MDQLKPLIAFSPAGWATGTEPGFCHEGGEEDKQKSLDTSLNVCDFGIRRKIREIMSHNT
jgi:hypothetical protein